MIGQIRSWIRRGASSFFSSRVEDSSRLRIAGFAALLVSAAALYWVGGELRFVAVGAALGAVGHVFSYRMRYRTSKLRPVAISVAVITLSVLMRNQMLETFNGNWMHVGHYLILVNGLSTLRNAEELT